MNMISLVMIAFYNILPKIYIVHKIRFKMRINNQSMVKYESGVCRGCKLDLAKSFNVH
jgi:hypothetical protein